MEILSVAEMYAADRTAMENGVAGVDLMDAAGKAVADAIRERWRKRSVLVLAGPGNNGGDGFVAARYLKQAKWPVTIYLMGEKSALKGDAAHHAKRWRNKVQPLEAALEVLAGQDEGADLLVIDALFGAGLSRPLDGTVKLLAELLSVSQAQHPDRAPLVVAVDVPSGLGGDTGRTMDAKSGRQGGGVCFHADLTVTFCRPKPAHALMPGRELCGEIVVADIGIADEHVDRIAPNAYVNTPQLWGDAFPHLDGDAHKYARGHVLVLGGEVMTGAARLAADAARRLGAGLVSIAAPTPAFEIYAASSSSGTLIQPFKDLKKYKKILEDGRKNTCVIGPGAGPVKATRDKALAALCAGKRCVLDADALSVFADDPKALFKAVKAQAKASGGVESTVLTPHGGEFARVFPDLAKRLGRGKDSKLAAARQAAKRAGCAVLFKGSDTVVAAPDGRAAITVNAPAWLATAGSGDVLSGMIGALLAQGMPAFEAASAAAWLHGEAAAAFGPGLIAEDLIDEIPAQLGWLLETLH